MMLFGYEFRNEALLEEALTTPACRMNDRRTRDNQRLEFLGDAVLGLLAADRLFRACPAEQEGQLTVRRTHMVSAAALCAAAAESDFASRLRRNHGAAPLASNAKTIADAVEAVLGAAWLDGGLEAARRIFDALALADRSRISEWSENPKGELQVRTQAMHPPRHPVYTLLRTVGRAHEPIFTVKVSVDGVGEATAEARSRKEAEAAAAAMLLSNMV